MIKQIVALLRKLIREVKMKAPYWTAWGAMLIPVGVVVLLEKPELYKLAYGLIFAGFASFIAGWGYTIKEENRITVKENEAKQRMQLEYKQRDKEHDEYLLVLGEIAKKMGVSIPLLNMKLRRQAEKRKSKEEDKNDSL